MPFRASRASAWTERCSEVGTRERSGIGTRCSGRGNPLYPKKGKPRPALGHADATLESVRHARCERLVITLLIGSAAVHAAANARAEQPVPSKELSGDRAT